MINPEVLLQTLSGDNCRTLEVFLEAALRLNAALKVLKLGVLRPSLPLWVQQQEFAPDLG